VLFVRASDIPGFVEEGVADIGITGLDIVEESGRRVERLLDLGFGRCRLVVAVPNESKAATAADLPENARVATSFPNLARRFFAARGAKVHVVEVSGATEVTPHMGVADAIVDLVSSGSTLAMNHLRETDVILHSSAHVVGNGSLHRDAAKAAKAREFLEALEAVVRARGKAYLMANVPRAKLADVRRILPGISGPTIMDIMDHNEMVAAHAVVDERALHRIVRDLKEIGATGILVLPIERLVP